MPSSPLSFGQVIALVAVLAIATWLIRRAGRDLRAELRRRGGDGPGLTPEQLLAITEAGLATPDQLFAMSAKEQQILAATAMAMRDQSQRRTREQ